MLILMCTESAPVRVTDLAAVNRSDTAIELRWTAPASVGSLLASNDVRISVLPITTLNWDSVANIRLPQFSYPAGNSGVGQVIHITGLTTNTYFYVAMKTIDANGQQSTLSNVVRVRTQEFLAGVPRLLWDPNLDIQVYGYKAFRGTASRDYSTNWDVGFNTQTPLWGLQGGVTYYFAVTAYTADGLESAHSDEVSYTPYAPPSP
jgi:hypothetical protein